MATPQLRIAGDIEHVLGNDTGIAAAAGLTVAAMPTHVFRGLVDSFIGGRNRGRLPYIEFEVDQIRRSDIDTSLIEGRQPGTIRIRVPHDRPDVWRATLDNLAHHVAQSIRSWWFNASNRYEADPSPTVASQLYAAGDFREQAAVDDHMSSLVDVRFELDYVADRGDLGDV